MPRRPTHRHIIREIRLTLGWSQEDLSRRIGANAGTLNRIENGTLAISKRLALRIYWLTGVHWEDIRANREGRPQTQYGPLERDHLERLTEHAKNLPDKEFNSLLDNAAYFGELLLRSCRVVAPQKLWALDAAILFNFENLVEEFALLEGLEIAKAEITEETRKNLPPKRRKQLEELGRQLKAKIVKINASLPAVRSSKKPEHQPV